MRPGRISPAERPTGDAGSMPQSVLDLDAVHPSAVSSAGYQGNNAGLSLQVGKLTGGEGTMNVKGLLPMGRHDAITKVSLLLRCPLIVLGTPPQNPPPFSQSHPLSPCAEIVQHAGHPPPQMSSSLEPRVCTPQTL